MYIYINVFSMLARQERKTVVCTDHVCTAGMQAYSSEAFLGRVKKRAKRTSSQSRSLSTLKRHMLGTSLRWQKAIKAPWSGTSWERAFAYCSMAIRYEGASKQISRNLSYITVMSVNTWIHSKKKRADCMLHAPQLTMHLSLWSRLRGGILKSGIVPFPTYSSPKPRVTSAWGSISLDICSNSGRGVSSACFLAEPPLILSHGVCMAARDTEIEWESEMGVFSEPCILLQRLLQTFNSITEDVFR